MIQRKRWMILKNKYAMLAQLVEHLICIQMVGGSSPSRSFKEWPDAEWPDFKEWPDGSL